jgi:hypothetical protein
MTLMSLFPSENHGWHIRWRDCMKPKKIFNHPDLEIYWPSKVTWVGFLVAWLFVILIIVGTMILARIGS